MRGFASTSIFARIHAPRPSAASFSSTGESCLQGPHHSAQRSTTTGTCIERSMTSAWNVSSVTSRTTAGAAPPPAAGGATAARGVGGTLRGAAGGGALLGAGLEAGQIDGSGHRGRERCGLGRLAGIGTCHEDESARCGEPSRSALQAFLDARDFACIWPVWPGRMSALSTSETRDP